MEFIILLTIGIFLFLLPSIIAVRKDHQYKTAIILLNVLGGLIYGLGWFIALVWCFITKGESVKFSPAEELDRLFELKQKGAISASEYEEKKRKLLKI
ncbi:hypothetical protein BCU68_12400 [Vibrio sp. 10N.286.49.B3]|uniref:superinfection immunity protein n=1 Tax=Vibrio sp. 10N.286.49.B3 TaxID=1880855 RepID=UPI000C8463A9|nr:superinfection immunity protein [Vibrio sp. 10N.286.49.B3]PMH44642.1 hypothetical protein BCU68_12400 [Vibrio sp. 10N.286.49.B3]